MKNINNVIMVALLLSGIVVSYLFVHASWGISATVHSKTYPVLFTDSKVEFKTINSTTRHNLS